MAITWIETNESRSASLSRKGLRANSSVTVSYNAFGTDDDQEVHDYAWNFFGGANREYVINDYVFVVETYDVEYLGDKAWKVTAKYTKTGAEDDERPDPLRRTRSFDTGGGSQHITQAFGERRYGVGAPSQLGAIGVDGENVNGVDIVLPALQWTETYDVPASFITQDYIKGVASITGCVNSQSFRTFEPGEVLFLGCTGNQEWDSERGNGPWNLSYKFQASRNVTGLTVGSITGVAKQGHEYLWVRYEPTVDGGTLLKTPKHVYVNEVYRTAAFSGLGIGS